MKGPPIGIDLGTTRSVVATVEAGRPRVVPNREGEPVTPSVVAFSAGGGVLVGRPALAQAPANPARTILSVKRCMGLDRRFAIGSREYSPQEISALILRHLKEDAEAHLGERVREAVITVPAYFNDLQRQATREAASLAGLDVPRLLSEPTAAALAYGLDRAEAQTVMVWDLGGGTFDVSILELGDGVFEVRAVSGDNSLGGDDFDLKVIGWLAGAYRRCHGVPYPRDAAAQARLREAAERAKIRLSQASRTRVFVPYVERSPVPRHLDAVLSLSDFEDLLGDLLQRLGPPTRQVMADAGLRAPEIGTVILVGNATRLPAVRRVVTGLMGQEPYRCLDPDLVTAMGAALQAGVLAGLVERAALLDVLPLSLGAETQGGVFARIIPRNAPLPAVSSLVFTTAADNQTAMDLNVVQGERALCADNVSLGRFELDGLPPGPRGSVKVEIAFEVDVDGIVHATARDLLTDEESSARFVSSLRLDAGETRRLVEEAASRRQDDRRREEAVRAGIEAGNTIRAAEMAVEALADRADDPGLERLVEAVERARAALAGDDPAAVRRLCGGVRRILAGLG